MNMHNKEPITLKEFLTFFYEAQSKEWLVGEMVEDAISQTRHFPDVLSGWKATAKELNFKIVE